MVYNFERFEDEDGELNGDDQEENESVAQGKQYILRDPRYLIEEPE